MKKRARKIIWFSVILFVALASGFYFGYTPIHLKKDTVGVFVSKTNGVSEKPVLPGVFQWNWQALIPTNASLRCFSNKPFTYKTTKSGELPGGDIYSKLMQDNPSFKYSFTVSLELKAEPSQFVELVKKSDIATESDLNSKYNELAEAVVNKVEVKLLGQYYGEVTDKNIDVESIAEEVKKSFSDSGFVLNSLNITNAKLPSYRLYSTAKDIHTEFMNDVQAELMKLSAAQAKEIAENTKNLNKLEKFGQVLREYKELTDLLKSSKDLNETLKAIYQQN